MKVDDETIDDETRSGEASREKSLGELTPESSGSERWLAGRWEEHISMR